MDSLSVQIDNLYYNTIERKIIDFYDMGMASSSNIPIQCSEDTYGTYILIGTKKQGSFNIKINKQSNGMYLLCVYPVGKLKCK